MLLEQLATNVSSQTGLLVYQAVQDGMGTSLIRHLGTYVAEVAIQTRYQLSR
jgi:hypothetical protein